MKRILTLLVPGFADWEVAQVVAGARDHFGFEVAIATSDGKPVRSMGGLHVLPDHDLAGIDPARFDLVLIPGGAIWEGPEPPEIGEFVTRSLDSGGKVAAICGATIPLARAGLLDDRHHTSNDPEYLPRFAPGYRGRPLYQDVPAAVVDRGVVTAPGAAPITFAAEVFRLLVPTEEPAIREYLALYAREHR